MHDMLPLAWAYDRGVALRLIEPGKPNQNAYIESFTGRFREECLNEHWFTSLAKTRTVDRPRHTGMSLWLLKFSDGSVDDYAICRSS
jgi:transposase InsO family protein